MSDSIIDLWRSSAGLLRKAHSPNEEARATSTHTQDNQIRLQRIEAAMARSERSMSTGSAMGLDGISEPDVAVLVSEMRNLERRLSSTIRPAVRCPFKAYSPTTLVSLPPAPRHLSGSSSQVKTLI